MSTGGKVTLAEAVAHTMEVGKRAERAERDARERDEADLRMWAEVTAREPGLHQVNPINQAKA